MCSAMSINSYQNQAEVLVNSYLLGDSFVPYTSILGGILACKLGVYFSISASYKLLTLRPLLHIICFLIPSSINLSQIYDLFQLFSALYLRSYEGLTKMQRVEWNNRGVSTAHAVYIAAMSLYFVFWSDLFADDQPAGLVTFRRSVLSTFALGVSVGYFIADLGLLLWFYPSLGGKEFVLHHSLSGIAVAYAMLSGEGQLYTFMILISEVTTPEINLRWFLDTAGLKRSGVYLINGVMIFLAWLVARILLFVYTFYHVYLHFDQVMQMHPFGFLLVFAVPSVLSAMNMMWFGKIVKGMVKTLTKSP